MKKKILVLGLILTAAFVLFTSCDPMSIAEGVLKDYEIKSDNTNATLSVSYSKFLSMGGYVLKIATPYSSETGAMKIKGLFEKKLVLSNRKKGGTSLTNLELKITNKKVTIDGHTFDLSPIM